MNISIHKTKCLLIFEIYEAYYLITKDILLLSKANYYFLTFSFIDFK